MNKTINFLFLMLVLFSSCTHKEVKHKELIELPVTNPKLMDTKVTQEYVCQIHASKHIELRALERGYLEKIYVDEGQLVKQGQPMFQILPNVYEADYQKSQAEVSLANIEYLNTKALADSNVVSKNELALSKANLEKAKAEMSLALAHLNFTSIKAPFSGIMDHLIAREGSLLDEGELLTTLSDNSKMWVYFNVTESVYLDYMTKSEKDRPKQVYLKMANGEIFNQAGIIDAIEGEFNNETGTIQFRANFPNPERVLRHGQTGTIMIDVPYKNALIIPQKATFEVLDKKYVFVLNKDNKLEQRAIEVAEELKNTFIIKSGLTKEDKVLIDGLRKVVDGDEIKMKFEKPEDVLSNLDLYAE